MKLIRNRSFAHCVGAAFVLSLVGGALFAALTPVFGVSFILRALVAGLGLAYVLYLLGTSGERLGRMTTLVAWGVASAVTWFASPPLALFVLIHVGMVWLIRSLYFYAGMLPVLADLGLSGLALAFSVWAATRSGSAFLAFWCFFLMQALFVFIPATLRENTKAEPSSWQDDETFLRAHRAAEAAIRRLSSVR